MLAGIAFALAAVLAVALITYTGRHLTFWQDEWGFIQDRLSWDLDAFMKPHNEHWATGIALLWKPLLATIGMEEYWPYLLVLALFHVATAAAVFRYLLRAVSPLAGLAASVCVLFLGTAGENLFWAFQVGFVGATALGSWALVMFLEGDRTLKLALAASLLVAAVAMSGPGLFFVVAIASVVILSPPRRSQLWVLVPAVVAYLAWATTYGRDAARIDYVAAMQNLDAVVAFARVGVETATGNLLGVGPAIGLVVGVLLVVMLIWHLISGGPLIEGAVAGTAGLLSQFAITGLTRAFHLGPEAAGSSRYGYTAAVFVLIGAGRLAGGEASVAAPQRWVRRRSGSDDRPVACHQSARPSGLAELVLGPRLRDSGGDQHHGAVRWESVDTCRSVPRDEFHPDPGRSAGCCWDAIDG